MSDGPLTREEIKAACEAVGWEVKVSDGASGRVFWALDPTGPGWERFQHCMDLTPPGNRWLTPAREDALALLEATGLEWFIERYRKDDEGEAHIDALLHCPRRQKAFCASAEDLATAAVRAVNQATAQTEGNR